ncbi:hypothetical protein ACHAXS_006931 [Conticribra weissflogii]
MNNDLPPYEGRPLRPYTSYNLYFTLEKERLLQEIGEGYAANPPSAENIDSNQSSRPAQFRHLILPKDWYVVNAERKKLRDNKKKRPPPHGVLSFLELTKLVSEGWRNVDEETKRFCDGLAAQELTRYKKNVKDFISRHGEDAAKHVYKKRKKTSGDSKRRNHPNAIEQEPPSEDDHENGDENSTNQDTTAASDPEAKEKVERTMFDIIRRPDINQSNVIPRIGKTFVETLGNQDLGYYSVGIHDFGTTRSNFLVGSNSHESIAINNNVPTKESLLPDNQDPRQSRAKAFSEACPSNRISSRDIFDGQYRFPKSQAQTRPQSNHHSTSSKDAEQTEPEQEGIDISIRSIVDEDCAIGGMNDFHPVVEARGTKAPLRLSSCPSFSSFMENEKNSIPRERSIFRSSPTPSQLEEFMGKYESSFRGNAVFESCCPTRHREFRNASQHAATCNQDNVPSIFSRSGQSVGVESPTETNYSLFNSLNEGNPPTDNQMDSIQARSFLSYSRANSYPEVQNFCGNDNCCYSSFSTFRRWYVPANRRFSSGNPQLEMYMQNCWNAHNMTRKENQCGHKRFKPT